MSELTKEWLQQTIAELEEERDATPGAVNEDAARALEAMKRALASLEAKPVSVNDDMAYAFHHAISDSSLGSDEVEEIKAGLRAAFANVTAQPAPVSVPDDIDTRMKNAGMLSAAEIIAGQPIDAFMKHAGVVDLESLLKWSEMRRAEFLRMQAKYELGDNQKDDMYEWVISHVAAFSELHVNIRAAMLQGADGNSPAHSGCRPAQNCISPAQCGNSPAIPDGWVMVPEEPTHEMLEAGDEQFGTYDVYRRMIAASPQQEVK